MSSHTQKIYYLGSKGSYTEQAAKEFFGKTGRLIEVGNVYQILELVAKTESDSESSESDSVFGVVPVENSTEGSLKMVLDNVVEKNLKIVGEVYLPISHCLIGNLSKNNFGTALRPSPYPLRGRGLRVYSHPQAFGQCADWLKNNLPLAKLKETDSNSAAAKIVWTGFKSVHTNNAAIASEYCAKIYGLKILGRQLEENPNNCTRFLVLSGAGVRPPRVGLTPSKVSIFVILNDRVAALRDLLNIFAKYNINLSKIESLALKGQAWQYGFFIDFFGNLQDIKIKKAMQEIEQNVASLQILGNYESKQKPNKTTEDLIEYLRELFGMNERLVKGVGHPIECPTPLTRLLQTRLLIMPSIALYKFLNKIPLKQIYQPRREAEIIQKRLMEIKKKNIGNPELLIGLAKQNLSLAKELQKNIYQKLVDGEIKPEQIKKVELLKLRRMIDQIDENFDEVVASLPRDEQRRSLEKLLSELKLKV